jgi:hypothetical protein
MMKYDFNKNLLVDLNAYKLIKYETNQRGF